MAHGEQFNHSWEKDFEERDLLAQLVASEEFKQVSYQDQINLLVNHLITNEGYALPDQEGKHPEEIKTDKPWGAYITLEKRSEQYGDVIEKILIVRPTPSPIPDSWNTEGEFAKFQQATMSSINTALSFQRHHHRERETWKVLYGSGYHLTSEEDTKNPSLDSVKIRPISINEGQNTVEHFGKTWHSVVNKGDDYLILRETIRCLPGHPHDETDIERSHDLVGNRAGTNQNL